MSKNIHHEYCELFVALFVALNHCISYLKFCCIFPERYLCMQRKLELFSPKIVSALEYKEKLSLFTVYRKSGTSVQKQRDR